MGYQGFGEESNFKREVSTQKKGGFLGMKREESPRDFQMDRPQENSVAIEEGAFREEIHPRRGLNPQSGLHIYLFCLPSG